MKLLGNRILIKPLLQPVSHGGINLPEGAAQQSLLSIVVATGTGKDVQPELGHGIRVVVSRTAGWDLEWNGQMVRCVSPADIDAIVEKG